MAANRLAKEKQNTEFHQNKEVMRRNGQTGASRTQLSGGYAFWSHIFQ